jgi:hypothetical protein
MSNPQTRTSREGEHTSITLDLQDIDLNKVPSLEGSALALILDDLNACSDERARTLHSRHSSHSAHSAHPTFTWLHRGD